MKSHDNRNFDIVILHRLVSNPCSGLNLNKAKKVPLFSRRWRYQQFNFIGSEQKKKPLAEYFQQIFYDKCASAAEGIVAVFLLKYFYKKVTGHMKNISS